MPDPELLNRGFESALAIAGGGGVYTKTIEVPGAETLVVEVDLSGAADADLAVEVRPVASDGEVYPIALAVERSTGPTHAGGRVYYIGRFNVSAQERVQLRVVNNNVGAQAFDLNWRTR